MADATASEAITRGIREGMCRCWVNDPIGRKCFDHSEERMALLLSFVDGSAPEDDREEVRQHLMDCSRCRYIYVVTRHG